VQFVQAAGGLSHPTASTVHHPSSSVAAVFVSMLRNSERQRYVREAAYVRYFVVLRSAAAPPARFVLRLPCAASNEGPQWFCYVAGGAGGGHARAVWKEAFARPAGLSGGESRGAREAGRQVTGNCPASSP